MPHVEIKVVDPATGVTVPRGERGRAVHAGLRVMLGYWDQPEATAEAIDAARWMHTGDLAVMRVDEYVHIIGRIKDMIIRGGENIYPREMEEFLYGHPAIADVQVIGVPDAKYGEEVARLRHPPRPGQTPSPCEELRRASAASAWRTTRSRAGSSSSTPFR